MFNLRFDIEELWAIQQLVRRTDQQGRVWDQADMSEVHRGILALTGSTTFFCIIALSEEFLWWIEAQVPQHFDLGRSNRGRNILVKVFHALHDKEKEESNDVWENALQDAQRGDPGADQDSTPGYASP